MAGLRQLGNVSDHWQEFDFLEFCDDNRPAPPSARDRSDAATGLAALAETIETEIVPRLMLAHRAELQTDDSAPTADAEPSNSDVTDFAALVVTGDMRTALGFIDELRHRGVALETIYIDLMAPAARHLGEQWLEDRCDFITVTLGLSRMQQLLSALGTIFESDQVAAETTHRALLVTSPGEQHTFGLYMVAEFFRRSGWDVWGGVPESGNSVLESVMDDWFDVVGLSISAQDNLQRLRENVRRIRKSSRNRQIGVLLGGSAFDGRECSAQEYGAHAIVTNGRDAVNCARDIVGAADRRLS